MPSFMKFFIVLVMLSFRPAMAEEHFTEDLNFTTYPHDQYGYSYQALTDGIRLNFTSWLKEDEALDGQMRSSDVHTLTVQLKCSKKVKIKRSATFTMSGTNLTFDIYDRKFNAGRTYLIFNEKDTNCVLKGKVNNTPRSIAIAPFTEHINHLWNNQVLTHGKESFSDLEDGVEAINKRIEILTGKRVSAEKINERNPKMEMDFSQMPKYDFILFSTLQFNHDYVSNIVFRALAEHAKRGTPVVVVGNTRLIGEKEQGLLDWLQKQSPLVKILQYQYRAETKNLGDQFDRIHRVSHVKFLITYSKDKPENSHVIFGGRNNSDRYFFPSFKKFDSPEYTQFDEELLNSWAYFHDLEYYVHSDKLAKRALTLMLTFLKLETPESQMFEDEEGDDIRITLSVPYRNKEMLEKEYISAIDNAKTSIKMLSPYIYFTDGIDQALARAHERGVQVEAITSASLLGDDMTKSLKGIYDKYSNQRKEYITVYSFGAEKEYVMHRKALLVDEKVLMLGSVNLSKRSFFHDVENNLTITNPELIKSFLRIYSKQLSDSEQIVVASKTTLTERIVKWLDQENLL